MSSTIVSSSYTIGLLTSFTDTTIAAGISVTNLNGPGITVAIGSAFDTIVNDGTVKGFGHGAVLMQSGGAATNATAGVIIGASYGITMSGAAGYVLNAGFIQAYSFGAPAVALANGGTVVNVSGGDIRGNGPGVYIAGGAASVGNAGILYGVYGVELSSVASGGSVSNLSGGTIAGGRSGLYILGSSASAGNAAGGTIQGYFYGVKVTGATATVTNAGIIASTGSLFDNSGILLNAGGSVSNSAGGTITGAKQGLYIRGGLATVSNAGSIGGGILILNGGTIANLSGGSIASGIAFAGTGSIGNAAGGTIVGGNNGIFFESASESLDNAGLIQGAKYDGVDFALGGTVVNRSGGTIDVGAGATTSSDGIRFSNGFGSVANAGDIVGPASGYAGISLSQGGYVSNASTGTIQGFHDGIQSTGAAAGTVVNAGLIEATAFNGVDLRAGGYVHNLSGGAIVGASAGVHVVGGYGTVANAGSIGASGGYAIYMNRGGYITNASGGTIAGTGGIDDAGFFGTRFLVNDGLITASSGAGIQGGSAAAYVTNVSGGTILAQAGAVALEAGGTLVNAGSIASNAQYGVGIFGGVVSNQSTGTIAAKQIGVRASGVSTVFNQGAIVQAAANTLASYEGVELGGNASLTNASGGTISAGVAGVYIQANTEIVNMSGGTIYGGRYGIKADASHGTIDNRGMVASGLIGVYAATGTSLTNEATGTIAGYRYGVQMGQSGTVVNAGLIDATAASAFFVNAGVRMIHGGTLTNTSTGTIAASVYDVEAAGAAATLVNLGILAPTGGKAVYFADGGYVMNAAGRTLAGTYDGILVTGAAGTVGNSGAISGTNDYGIALNHGGFVTNTSTGTITGGEGGIHAGALGTILNAGTISGTVRYGIYLEGGGSVTNTGTGSIAGRYDGIRVGAAVGTVANSSIISGGILGVYLRGGGLVTNAVHGTITGGSDGVRAVYAAATVDNQGSIVGTSEYGVLLAAGGSVSNASGGIVEGATNGVYGESLTTIENAGTISAGTATKYAITFNGGYNDRVIVDPGAVFVGKVNGVNAFSSGFASTLELAAGAAGGTISGVGYTYTHFVQTTIDAGASWTLAGTNYLAANYTLTNAGTLTLLNGTLNGTGVLINNGTVVIDPSTLTVAGLYGTGSTTIDANSTLTVTGTVAAGQTIAFGSNSGELAINPNGFQGTITGFVPGDTLGLTGLTGPSTGTLVNGNTLDIVNNGTTIALALTPGSGFSGESFNIDSNGTVSSVPCFLRDTKIRTAVGETRVQDLAVGDMVETLSGTLRPIAWIGVGKVLVSPGKRSDATPVIVRRNALADGVPYYDLRITKGHALYIDGVLIPAEFLVNHRNILWDDHKREVEFYHIELDAHDVLIANGAPSESYRDDGNRWMFRNANSGWGQPAKPPCAPVLTGGPVVDAIWRRILDRDTLPRPAPVTGDPDLHLLVDGRRIDAFEHRGDRRIFRLPPAPASVRIVSRAAAPAEVGYARDPRRLGVAVTQILVFAGKALRAMPADDPALADGFHAFEPELGLRWTDGDAVVPATLFAELRGAVELVLHVGGTAQYSVFAEAAA